MTIVVFVLVALLVLGAFGALHWYAWRRLVRDTTRGPGLARRVGTVVFVAGPVLMFAGFAAERTGAPFWLQQTLTWPGFMWLALSLYLLLALVAGELVRPLVSRLVARRAPEPVRQPEPLVREPEPQPSPADAQPPDITTPPAAAPPWLAAPPDNSTEQDQAHRPPGPDTVKETMSINDTTSS
nr:metallophosphoesterase [Streptomyces europaeiscabiei]